MVEGFSFDTWCEHLGACIGKPSSKQWRAFHKHEKRVTKTQLIFSKIGLLPISVQQKAKNSRSFAISRFGWTKRFPSCEVVQDYRLQEVEDLGTFFKTQCLSSSFNGRSSWGLRWHYLEIGAVVGFA